ncbi:hypothetical protein [uncultured Brevundimonas sp.]|uniref:hypothetical protein n=1 Tax=uncultured Brevundimonas sp. TaxID=213418 RepID=UPI0025EDCEF1|nr:hypothetical protein [uncultured Brevundimonas sp.]
MIPDALTRAQAEALEELFHQCDLIATRPLPCEIEWTLNRVAPHVAVDTVR